MTTLALEALSKVVRYGYGMGLTPPPGSDERAIDEFRGFLLGAGPPAIACKR